MCAALAFCARGEFLSWRTDTQGWQTREFCRRIGLDYDEQRSSSGASVLTGRVAETPYDEEDYWRYVARKGGVKLSYSFSGKASDGRITEWNQQPQHGYGEQESEADLVVARDIAEMMVANLGGEVSVSGGGHANPNRTPEGNWACDCMNVSVVRQ